MPDSSPTEQGELEEERYEALRQLEGWLETPVMVLGLVWLGLLVVELTWGLNPLLNALVYTIWAVFLLDFGLRFFLAPDRTAYLRHNWLTVLSLALPALRILRIGALVRLLRVSRAARGVQLVKVVGSLNRGMRALRTTLERRRFGYVAALTLVVALVGAAGMLAFERTEPNTPGFASYGEALWFTAMLMTTLGSEFWPRTAEGRILAFLLSLYAFAVFGYVTATLATFFIGRDAQAAAGEGAAAGAIRALQAEIADLRDEIRDLSQQIYRPK